MTTNATPQNVKDLGFPWDLFRSLVESEAEYDGFIQAVLDDNKDDILAELGATIYGSAALLSEVTKIEKYYAAAELLRRRSNIIKGQAIPDGPTGAAELEAAKDYEQKVLRLIGRITSGDTLAASVHKSNHFGQTET